MTPYNVLKYVVGAIVLFAIYFIGVPALISAKSTVAVVAGVFLILAGAAFVVNYVIKAFSNEKEKSDAK